MTCCALRQPARAVAPAFCVDDGRSGLEAEQCVGAPISARTGSRGPRCGRRIDCTRCPGRLPCSTCSATTARGCARPPIARYGNRGSTRRRSCWPAGAAAALDPRLHGVRGARGHGERGDRAHRRPALVPPARLLLHQPGRRRRPARRRGDLAGQLGVRLRARGRRGDRPGGRRPDARTRPIDHIAGFVLFCDWSARDLQGAEMALNLGPAKGKDSANGFGPWLVTTDELAERAAAAATTSP